MISIIIIVKNDFRIKKLIEHLQHISYPDKKEIIVVDASNGLLDQIKKEFSEIHWIQFKNKVNKQRTFSEQRNIGVKNAKGNIIIFIDADCIPVKNWVIQLLQPIYKENEQIISGAIKPLNNNNALKEEKYGKYRDECETMNIAITKHVFETIGSFDETLEGCEDSDFCIRARRNGFKIRFQKDAIVYHDWGGFIQNIKRSFHGGQDRVLFYKKYPKLLFSFSINNIYTWFYLLYVVFAPIIIIFPIYFFIVFIPSIVKLRNPIKEIYNISFAIGFIIRSIRLLLHI